MADQLQPVSLDRNTFIVVVEDESKEIVEGQIKNVFPDHHYQIADNCFLISTHKSMSGRVSIEIGIDGENRKAAGAVFKLNGSFAGYTDKSLWDWMDQAEKRGDSLEPTPP